MKIWSAWLQGRKNAPQHVQKIFGLWEELNPNAEICVLEQSEVNAILHEMGVNDIAMTPQVKANIVRTYLLTKYGGAWVDATLLPTKPLELWLTPELRKEGFFAFRSTGMAELVLQNWFLYAEKNNPLMISWLDLYCEYFKSFRFPPGSRKIFFSVRLFDYFKYRSAAKRRDFLYFVDPNRGRSCSVYPYAFHNYTLAYILKTDPKLASMWSNVPTLYNVRPGLIGHYASDIETPDQTFLEVALDLLQCSPVHKLNHRDARFSVLIETAKARGLITQGGSFEN